MKNLYRFTLLSIILLMVTVVCSSSFAEEVFTENKINKYTFNYDQEIPTLIRYGSKVSGIVSKTGYIGFIQREDGNSRSSIDIGYNITGYEFAQPPSIGRLFSIIGFGYIPFLSEIAYSACTLTGDKERHISMVSPLIGYSYLQNLTESVGFDFFINTGPAYANKITPYKNEDEIEDEEGYLSDYDGYIEAYNTMHNVSGHWGGRINTRIKLYFRCGSDNDVLFGLNLGYTQYFFRNNHFNSYDIGPAFTLLF